MLNITFVGYPQHQQKSLENRLIKTVIENQIDTETVVFSFDNREVKNCKGNSSCPYIGIRVSEHAMEKARIIRKAFLEQDVEIIKIDYQKGKKTNNAIQKLLN